MPVTDPDPGAPEARPTDKDAPPTDIHHPAFPDHRRFFRLQVQCLRSTTPSRGVGRPLTIPSSSSRTRHHPRSATPPVAAGGGWVLDLHALSTFRPGSFARSPPQARTEMAVDQRTRGSGGSLWLKSSWQIAATGDQAPLAAQHKSASAPLPPPELFRPGPQTVCADVSELPSVPHPDVRLASAPRYDVLSGAT